MLLPLLSFERRWGVLSSGKSTHPRLAASFFQKKKHTLGLPSLLFLGPWLRFGSIGLAHWGAGPAQAQSFCNSFSFRLQIVQRKRAQLCMSALISSPRELCFSPLVVVSGSLVAAAVSMGRRGRASPLAQLLTCYFMRRYLVLLGRVRFELCLRGGVSLFPVLWRHLVTPTDEVYWNPLAQSWVFDVRVPLADFSVIRGAPSLESWANLAGWRLVSGGLIPVEAWAAFKASLGSRGATTAWFVRYLFSWEMVFFQPALAFGLVKNPKARRLPRRQTKRLVGQAQLRFWVW